MERLVKIGQVKPVTSFDVKESRMGLGMEKLDRDSFEPEKVYDKVSALGVKWIRLQSGWQKTEKQEGIYDFAWLDSQVDNLLERNLKPWVCLCYGNTLYDELAKEYYGTVGCPPIRSERAYSAWLNYVKATVEHFKNRVEYYEIWNEPDGSHTWRPEPNQKEYAEFCIKTAEAIKAADENAKILTGSNYQDSIASYNEQFANGTLKVSDAITFHSYNYDERISMQRIHALKGLLKHYGSDIEIIQGETGSQSKSGGGGALANIRTDKTMQVKQILRHTIADLLCGIKFTSLFSCVDMAENLNARAGKPINICGYFGLLQADFDKETGQLIGDYYEKPSYYAYQNLCALFNENMNPTYIPVLFNPTNSTRINGFDCPTKELIYGGFEKANGSKAFVYWNSTSMITEKDYEGTVTFELAGIDGDVRLVDPMDGSVYAIPEDVMVKGESGLYTFKNMPVIDYPLIITFGEFFECI